MSMSKTASMATSRAAREEMIVHESRARRVKLIQDAINQRPRILIFSGCKQNHSSLIPIQIASMHDQGSFILCLQEDEISSDTIANLILRNFIGSRLVDKNTIEISDDHKRRSIVKAVCRDELLQGIEGPDLSTWC